MSEEKLQRLQQRVNELMLSDESPSKEEIDELYDEIQELGPEVPEERKEAILDQFRDGL